MPGWKAKLDVVWKDPLEEENILTEIYMMGRTQPQGEMGSCFPGRKQQGQSLEVRSELNLFEKTRVNKERVVDGFWTLFLYSVGYL